MKFLIFSVHILLIHFICHYHQILLLGQVNGTLEILFRHNIPRWITGVDKHNRFGINSFFSCISHRSLCFMNIESPFFGFIEIITDTMSTQQINTRTVKWILWDGNEYSIVRICGYFQCTNTLNISTETKYGQNTEERILKENASCKWKVPPIRACNIYLIPGDAPSVRKIS